MQSGRTADRLYDAVMNDNYEELSLAAIVDFGIDRNRDLFYAYQKAVRENGVTADQLFDAMRSPNSGKALTELIGVPVSTGWDDLNFDDDGE